MAIYRDDDGDVCVDDGRAENLVFCPAHDDGWPSKELCPDVIAEIINRFNAHSGLVSRIEHLELELAQWRENYGKLGLAMEAEKALADRLAIAASNADAEWWSQELNDALEAHRKARGIK